MDKRKTLANDLVDYIDKQQFEEEDEDAQMPNFTDFHLLSLNDNYDRRVVQKPIDDPPNIPNGDVYGETENVNEEIQALQEDMCQKFQNYIEMDKKEFELKRAEKPLHAAYLKATKQVLTDQELQFILKEYQKEQGDRDYEALDSICQNLKFFQKFSRSTRIYLLKLAKVIDFPSQHVIFNQGDEGDLMYIIIRGKSPPHTHTHFTQHSSFWLLLLRLLYFSTR